jgi:hypothetical protein
MNLGYPGSYNRMADCVIRNRPVLSTDTTNINFGDPVILNSDDTWSRWSANTTNTAAQFAGVAVREVKQSTSYPACGFPYLPGQPCDVIQRGSVAVYCQSGTPAPGGTVYLRTVVSGAKIVGGFEADSTSDQVTLTNAKWGSAKDANGVASLVILTRLQP